MQFLMFIIDVKIVEVFTNTVYARQKNKTAT